jgi:hypothetical protein
MYGSLGFQLPRHFSFRDEFHDPLFLSWSSFREGVRSAAKALGHSAALEVKGAKKRVLSAAERAAIAKAAKKRWAKVRKQAKKVAG